MSSAEKPKEGEKAGRKPDFLIGKKTELCLQHQWDTEESSQASWTGNTEQGYRGKNPDYICISSKGVRAKLMKGRPNIREAAQLDTGAQGNNWFGKEGC